MKRKFFNLSRHYQAVLRKHLRQGQRANPESAPGLGRRAVAAGLQTLDLAKLNERILMIELLPACHADKRAALGSNPSQGQGTTTTVQIPLGPLCHGGANPC